MELFYTPILKTLFSYGMWETTNSELKKASAVEMDGYGDLQDRNTKTDRVDGERTAGGYLESLASFNTFQISENKNLVLYDSF